MTIFWPIIWTIFGTLFKGVLKHWASILFTSICWQNEFFNHPPFQFFYGWFLGYFFPTVWFENAYPVGCLFIGYSLKHMVIYIKRLRIDLWCTAKVHTGYIEVIMQGKCGRNTEITFDIKWVIGTYGNWKNQNPGGRFGATS